MLMKLNYYVFINERMKSIKFWKNSYQFYDLFGLIASVVLIYLYTLVIEN